MRRVDQPMGATLMPLKQLRVCIHCDRVRWAPCSTVCRVGADTDPDSWRVNLQDGAGTLPEENM